MRGTQGLAIENGPFCRIFGVLLDPALWAPCIDVGTPVARMGVHGGECGDDIHASGEMEGLVVDF